MTAANQDGLWTIVIFRDLHLEEVLNLEILSLVISCSLSMPRQLRWS
jgi:hypothetical protein